MGKLKIDAPLYRGKEDDFFHYYELYAPWNVVVRPMLCGDDYSDKPTKDEYLIMLRREKPCNWQELRAKPRDALHVPPYRTIGIFFPEHRMLIDIGDPFSGSFFRGIRARLRRGLSYTVVRGLDPTWEGYRSPINPEVSDAMPEAEGDRTNVRSYRYERDIMYLTRKRTSFKAFDGRAMQILDTLMNRLPDGKNLTYTFAQYKIRIKNEGSAYIEEPEEIRLGLMKLVRLRGSNVSPEVMEALCKSMPPSWALGIKSNVTLDGKEYHIPMVDFFEGMSARRPNSHEELTAWYNIGTFKDHGMGMAGMVVESGRSLHFYGFRLLDDKQWASFMDLGRDMFYADKMFFDVQRASGSTLLRITPALAKLSQPCLYALYDSERLHPVEEEHGAG